MTQKNLLLWALVFICSGTALWANDRYEDLYKPTDLAVHPNGEIFVLDSGNHRVVVLDERLQERLVFGQKGKGPGEFLRPAALAFLDENHLLIADSEANHVLVFDLQGKYLRVFLKESQSIGQLLVIPGKGVWTTEHDGQQFSFRMGEDSQKFPVRFFNLAGDFVRGVGVYKTHEIPFVSAQMNHGSLATDGQRVFFARFIENELEVFDGEKTATHKYAPAFPPKKPDGKMVEEKQPDGSISFQMKTEADVHCFDLLGLKDGSLLMLRAKSPETDGITPTELVILKPSGELLKTYPDAYRAKRMSLGNEGRFVYLIDEDDDGWFIRKTTL